jgi:uncharacterized protein (DUF433 family)
MTRIEQAEQLLDEMNQSEKMQLLQMIARDLSSDVPGVVKTPGICGGDARIQGTRIPVWALMQYRQLGASDADLLRAFPTLSSEDLANAWQYARRHPEEIKKQILENETA